MFHGLGGSLVLLTDVDGLYTANPFRDPTAKRFGSNRTHFRDDRNVLGKSGSSNGIGGMLTKLLGSDPATESGGLSICSSLKSDA